MGFQWALSLPTHLFILNKRAPLLFTINLMKPDSSASIMNWSKNLYVFMLGAIIVFSGCVGTGTSNGDDGDADDTSTSGTTIVNNYYNNTPPSNGLNWYTSGGTHTTWNDDNSAGNGEMNWMQGDYNDEQGTWNQTSTLNDWNVTECVGQGGEARITRDTYDRDNIYCDLTFTTINTSSGEVLMIYQFDEIKLTTTCDGVSDTITGDPLYSGNEYQIVTGSALNCEHRVWTTLQYHVDHGQKISSIVFTIQDAIVV